MPVVNVPLEDTNRTIIANAYNSIIKDIVEDINIPFGTLVVIHKDTEASLTDNRDNATRQGTI